MAQRRPNPEGSARDTHSKIWEPTQRSNTTLRTFRECEVSGDSGDGTRDQASADEKVQGVHGSTSAAEQGNAGLWPSRGKTYEWVCANDKTVLRLGSGHSGGGGCNGAAATETVRSPRRERPGHQDQFAIRVTQRCLGMPRKRWESCNDHFDMASQDSSGRGRRRLTRKTSAVDEVTLLKTPGRQIFMSCGGSADVNEDRLGSRGGWCVRSEGATSLRCVRRGQTSSSKASGSTT